MRILLLVHAIFISTHGKTQIVDASTTIPINKYIDALVGNLELPHTISEKYNNQDIQLVVVITITKEGDVFNPKIQNDSLQLSPYLKRAFEGLPKWNPMVENGKPVVSRKAFNLIIPVHSSLKEDKYDVRANPKNGLENTYKEIIGKLQIKGQAKITVKFDVEIDGSLTNIRIVNTDNSKYNSDVIRILKSMPKWIPAIKDGSPIRSELILPIMIKYR